MRMKYLVMLCLFSCSAMLVQAQVKPKPKPKATPKPVTVVQSATTDDGKRVNLKSDGTWEFDTQYVAPAPKPTPEPVVVPQDKFPPKVRAAAEAALKTLRRMGSAVEVGLTLSEYNTRLIDLKADVDENLSQIPDGELKTEIRLAVEAYVDAQNGWKEMGRHDTLYPDLEPGRSLMTKYSIPIDRSIGMALLPGRSVRNIIWLTAKARVDKASQLLSQ
jgi:hypothetical protein